jgi:type IV secretion system pilin
MNLRRIMLNLVIALAFVLAAVPALTGPSGHVSAAPAKGAPSTPAKGAPSTPAAAATPPSSTCPAASTSKGEVLQGLGETGSDCSDTQVDDTFKTAIMILSIVVGVASVVVIILSGFKYVVSGGEQGKVANAKNSLLYALVGVAVAALAQLMIHFVLYNANQ